MKQTIMKIAGNDFKLRTAIMDVVSKKLNITNPQSTNV